MARFVDLLVYCSLLGIVSLQGGSSMLFYMDTSMGMNELWKVL